MIIRLAVRSSGTARKLIYVYRIVKSWLIVDDYDSTFFHSYHVPESCVHTTKIDVSANYTMKLHMIPSKPNPCHRQCENIL